MDAGLGWLDAPQPTGAWEVPKVPAGRWTALAYYVTGVIDWDGEGGEPPVDCGTSPAHLDTWYRGASGWPIPSGVVSDGHTFASARTFSVLADVPVGNIEIEMLPAPTCRGRVPTIFGTTLADEIVGTGARDIIAALGGDDWIHGKAGNDLICGDAGNDFIDAGAGLKDAVDGGPGPADVCLNAENTWRCP